ncbi:entericidin A/B family lipoprotein [Martelella alba]|uniref:Entericidin A/B family lipoprotein n=1 Tax=Martelella alba TaxID=2590451 RepID=A0ABY2SQM1_9HYPH|nr:entericidin A/B family lipoprotein [Martelella alba]TKI08502.1 entericidin A/B family lipoprotein [Martelella alba]
MLSKLIKVIVTTMVMLVMLSGCNTARGFGEDVQHLGNTISHAAN